MNQNELMHFGVKGMKWGHHKANPYVTSMQNAKSRYKSNKKQINSAYTKAGEAYDMATKGSKISNKKADRALDAAADKWASDRKSAKIAYKQDKINIKKKAVSDYNKKFNSAERASNIADKKWNEVNEQYKALGKNKVERMIKAMGKSEAAKQYSKNYDEASRLSDVADKKWRESKEAYKQTGRNYVNRIFNNIKYDPNSKTNKAARSVKRNTKVVARNVAGKAYDLNSKVYDKLGNKTLASMNRTASNRINK